jgi:hypothetical protein
MTADEEAVFESELQQNKTLKEQAEAIAQMVKAMDVVGKEHDKELVTRMKSSASNGSAKKSWIYRLSIAASFALILTVGYFTYDYSRIGNLGKEYASTFPVSTIVRGEEDDEAAQKLTTLFNNVANGEDLDNTIVQLKELWPLSQSDTYNSYTNYEPYIGWNLAIAYLRNHDKREAKNVLVEMMKLYPEGTAMGDKVAELLKAL